MNALMLWYRRVVLCAIAAVSCVCAHAQMAAAPAEVARVVLVVGQAQRVAADGRVQPLAVGSIVAEQDRILTGDDGIVMLVFADRARLSVRPQTELVVRRYRVDKDVDIEFDLVRGVVRQISGEAARREPERYRLNTPIAVIGVRGTDYLARASAQEVSAYVHEGAIVVTPKSSDAAASGSDAAATAVLVSADHPQRMILLSQDTTHGQHALRTAEVEKLLGIRVSAHPAEGGGVVVAAARARIPTSGDDVAVAPPPTLADRLPDSVSQTSVPMPVQLAWGRFDRVGVGAPPFDLLQSYEQAAAGRSVTVGELGQYALWRTQERATLPSSLRGQFDFALAAGQAVLRTADASYQNVRITHSQLSIDFDRMRYGTELGLSAAQQPARALRAEGRINDEGIFATVGATQRVAGAVSVNGREAGYTFVMQTPEGAYQGVTLWSAR
ncbi:FecR family protein [Tepidimonas charontis]|uniref:FecR protein n=1 Tax=Tepidimonas charontis TaxID=2267262 RepID=A0A554XC96_9BURK|nr:FecR domain-containing protein [Tepidimonas charontis]TSE33472.1 FecR protein [Tepidimonas charontis]